MKHHHITTELKKLIVEAWPNTPHYQNVVMGCIARKYNGMELDEIMLFLTAVIVTWLIDKYELHPKATGFDSLVLELGQAVADELAGLL